MCRLGDIILIKEYKNSTGELIGQHPFIVLNDKGGEISGLPFDLTCSVMSSFKSDRHKSNKLKYKENVEVTIKDGVIKDGFIKADQIHYFKKSLIDFSVIGSVTPELFNYLMKVIQELSKENKLRINTNNLQFV